MATQLLLLSVSALLLVGVYTNTPTQDRFKEMGDKIQDCINLYNRSDGLKSNKVNFSETGVITHVNSTDGQCFVACACRAAGLMTSEGDVVLDKYLLPIRKSLKQLGTHLGRKVVLDEEALLDEVSKCDANEKGSDCTAEYKRIICVDGLFKESNVKKYLTIQE